MRSVVNKMVLIIPVTCLFFVGCHAASVDAVNFPGQQPTEKGFIDWVITLVGGSTTTPKPIPSEPVEIAKDCPPCKCGVANTKKRIVGGQETMEIEYPWMAMLMYNGRFFCGGSLINDQYVLTAAHCTGLRKDRMTVRLLEHDIAHKKNNSLIIDRKVAHVIRHQRYNPGTYDNDIALLKLDEKFDLSSAIKKRASRGDEVTTESEGTTEGATTTVNPEKDLSIVRPVCLPAYGLSYTKHCGLVAGWGTTEQGGQTSSTLQKVNVNIVSNKECRDRSYGRRLTDNMLCAGYPEGGLDACQGDSGGPLTVQNATTERHHVAGVVSWGEGCALPDKYGVYTRVNRYNTWIKSNTLDACYCD